MITKAARHEPPPRSSALPYRDLLHSLGEIARTQPVLQRHAIIGACGFAAFSILWTSLAFHLARLSPEYGPQTVGAFGLIGVTGAFVAPVAGHFTGRLGPRVMNGTGLVLIVVAFGLMAVSRTAKDLGGGARAAARIPRRLRGSE